MKKIIALSLMLSLSAGLFAQKLTIQGSTTVLPIAQAAAEAYMDITQTPTLQYVAGVLAPGSLRSLTARPISLTPRDP